MLAGTAIVVLVALMAAALAAIVAHVSIDVAGDVLLEHDTYDGFAHGSRGLIFGGVTVAALGIVLAAIGAGFQEARGRTGYGDVFERCSRVRKRWLFGGTLVASVLMLAGMEAIDALVAGHAVDDPSDLFGGSFSLALSIVVPLAIAAAFGAHRVLGYSVRSHRAIVKTLAAVFLVLANERPPDHMRSIARRQCAHVARTLGRRAGKRGPPAIAGT